MPHGSLTLCSFVTSRWKNTFAHPEAWIHWVGNVNSFKTCTDLVFCWNCCAVYSPSNKCCATLQRCVDMCDRRQLYILKSTSHVVWSSLWGYCQLWSKHFEFKDSFSSQGKLFPSYWIRYQWLNPSAWRLNMINTLTTTGELSLSRSRRLWRGPVHLSLVHSNLLLLLDRVEPRVRVIPKRINLCYSFGSEATQIRVMGVKGIFSFLLQMSNSCCFRSPKRTNVGYSLTCWTFGLTKYKNCYI